MSSHIVYGCHCLNIKIHLASKHQAHKDKSDNNFVNEPLPGGWDFELGMGGIIREYDALIKTRNNKDWVTVSCLNCGLSPVYSIKQEQELNEGSADKQFQGAGRVIIHENAVCGEEFEAIKKTEDYSNIFNIKVVPNTADIPQVVPEELTLVQQQMKNVLNQSIEKLSLESKLRIEKFQREEELKLQDLISQAKLENNYLLSKVLNLHEEEKELLKKKKEAQEEEEEENENKGLKETKHRNHHVRFNDQQQQQVEETAEEKGRKKVTKTSFALDENQIRGLENKIITEPSFIDIDEQEDDQDEDMFHLDEEFSDNEIDTNDNDNNKNSNDSNGEDDEDEDEDKQKKGSNDIAGSSSSASHDIFGTSWIRKKRNTSKYLAQDFDISRFKTNARKDDTTEEDDDDAFISKYATSVPISIHYPQIVEEKEEEEEDKNKNIPDTINDDDEGDQSQRRHNKRDILTSSFANYDFSYPDRMLSEQFPLQRRRKSFVSSSLIRPQLDTLVGKSLDTRGIMQKKANIREKDEENFGPMLPPHLWTALAEKEGEE